MEIFISAQTLWFLEIIEAKNGEEALNLCKEKAPEILITDIRMPVMDGLAATREIRSMDRPDAKTIPIIAMTANVFDEDVEKSKRAGMDAHLAKPVEPEKLYDAMAILIAERESAEQASQGSGAEQADKD